MTNLDMDRWGGCNEVDVNDMENKQGGEESTSELFREESHEWYKLLDICVWNGDFNPFFHLINFSSLSCILWEKFLFF